MSWTVAFHEDFQKDFDRLTVEVQDELLTRLKLLEEFGPTLGRPAVDTLIGSRFANLKEFRFTAKAFGGSPSLSIPSRAPSSWSAATRKESTRGDSTNGSSGSRTRVIRGISKR